MFYLDNLVEEPKRKWLVTGPSNSPENALRLPDGRTALTKAWPAGKVTGLRARGGFTVDVEWKDGKVTSYRIAAREAQPVKVRVNGELKTVNAEWVR